MLAPWKESFDQLRKHMTNIDGILKSRDITLLTEVCLVKAMVLPVVIYGCESWTIRKTKCQKNWCFWTVVLEKILESPLDCKEIKPVSPKGNQSGIFIGRTDAEAEIPILWPPDAKNQLIGKDPDAGEDWRQEEKGITEAHRVGYDGVIELNRTELLCEVKFLKYLWWIRKSHNYISFLDFKMCRAYILKWSCLKGKEMIYY